MVSPTHETLHRMFRMEPGLAIRSLQQLLHIPVPEPAHVSEMNTDLTGIEPLERRVDSLLRVETEEGDFLLAIEAQRKRDPDKLSAWGYYLAHLYAKYKLPPLLLVLCHDRTTAEWAGRPVDVGFAGYASLGVRPLALGPDQVPVYLEAKDAERDLWLASFSAVMHRDDPDAGVILEALATALKNTVPEEAVSFWEYTEAGLQGSPASDIWRTLMKQLKPEDYQGTLATSIRAEGREEGHEEGLEEGLEAGVTGMVLAILQQRGVPVSEEDRERITSCVDTAHLDTLARRALTATRADDLFADGAP